jgi:hypothetical protein
MEITSKRAGNRYGMKRANKMHKRKYFISITLIGLTSLILLAVNCSKQDLSIKAAKIHDEVLTIDTHTDTISVILQRTNPNMVV